MRVLADTCIGSLALRRARPVFHHASHLQGLIENFQVAIIGPIRQELLSGVRDENGFEHLRTQLEGFVDLPLGAEQYERAAAFHGECRRHGVQGSHTDFVICAAAERYDLAIYTVDDDFGRYESFLPIRLHRPT